MAIVGRDGSDLPPRALGEIAVAAPSVAQGYQGDASDSLTRFDRGWLFSGDAGFLVDGELFVLGRMGERIKVRGRTVYAEGLEVAIASALETPLSRCVVISTQHTASDAIVAIVERPAGAWAEEVAQVLRGLIGPTLAISVYAAPPGTIPRTTSGKPRRRRLWQQVASGELTPELLLLSSAGA